MPLSNAIYASVMRIYDDIRTQNRHIQNQRYEEVIALIPEFADIENQIITESMQEAKRRITANSSDTNFDEFASRLDSLRQKQARLLTSIGKPADYLDDIYTCPICQDTGYVNHKKCTCFQKKAIDLIYHDSNLKNITDNENFSTFSLAYYNNTDIDAATGLTPYNNMRKVLKVCKDFVKNFDSAFNNLLLCGETGIGKTFLANCIAKELMDSCHSVIYLTALELFESFESRDFNKNVRTAVHDTDYFLDCELLIIDDLGTENTNSYTVSKLFYIINERMLRQKSVIISTNYSISEIEDCYSERIFSRIISAYIILRLFGDDIRYQKRLENSSSKR